MATSRSINAAIDRINDRKTAGKRVTLVAAKNPAPGMVRDKTVKAPDLSYSVQRWNGYIGDWSTLAAFGLVDYAVKWAREYAKKFPSQTVRVVDRF